MFTCYDTILHLNMISRALHLLWVYQRHHADNGHLRALKYCFRAYAAFYIEICWIFSSNDNTTLMPLHVDIDIAYGHGHTLPATLREYEILQWELLSRWRTFIGRLPFYIHAAYTAYIAMASKSIADSREYARFSHRQFFGFTRVLFVSRRVPYREVLQSSRLLY